MLVCEWSGHCDRASQLEQFKTLSIRREELISGPELMMTLALVGLTMVIIWLAPRLTKLIPAPLIAGISAVVVLDVTRVGDLASLSAGCQFCSQVPFTRETGGLFCPCVDFICDWPD